MTLLVIAEGLYDPGPCSPLRSRRSTARVWIGPHGVAGAMQSFVMAIRSFLMISCMIIVPVLAIFGTDWLKEFGIGTSSSGPRRSSTNAAARRARTGVGDHGLSEAKSKA